MTALVVRGDARRLPLPDSSVDLIVTSPPYWAQRSYTDGGEHYDGQIGDEDTPGEYVAALVDCTREWVRVLKPEGSLFVNLGDKYATRYSSVRASGRAGLNGDDGTRGRSGQNRTGVPEKSLLGLPWRYAIACIDELGLILRSEIVWSKPNGLPESVTDRVRRSHEQWFHLTREQHYYSALDVLREPLRDTSMHALTRHLRRGGAREAGLVPGQPPHALMSSANPLGKLPGSVWEIPSEPLSVPTELGVDHFAAFPTEWPRRLILGWSPPGICVECGEGRAPVVERRPMEWRPSPSIDGRTQPGASFRPASGTMLAAPEARLLGWRCACTPYTDHPGTGEPSPTAGPDGRQGERPADIGRNHRRVGPWREYHLDGWSPPATTPAVVVDPFGGTGASALVASVLGRVGVSVDLSQSYCELARWRTTDRRQIAAAMRVPRPPAEADGQETLFDQP